MTSVVGVLLLSVTSAQAAEMPSAPTLVAPAHGSYTDNQSPWITGLAPAGTRVVVYIDDTFNGYAEVVSENDETLSFAYQPFLPLTYGEHTVKLRAENVAEGTRSIVTHESHFVVERTLPAPTLIGRVIDQDSTWQQPWVVGVAPSGATLEIWIDGVFNGFATVSESETGTGHFAYKPFLPLTAGKHEVQARTKYPREDGSTRYSETTQVMNLWVVDPATLGSEEDNTIEETTDENSEDTSEDTTEESTTDTTPDESTETSNEEAVEETNEEAASEEEVSSSEEEQATEETTDVANESESTESSEESTEEVETEEQGQVATENTSEEEATEEAATAEDTEEKVDARTIIGWVLLFIAAFLVARQVRMRQRGVNGGSEATPTQTPLDLKAEEKNSNIEVITPATKEEADSNAAEQVETATPTETVSTETTAESTPDTTETVQPAQESSTDTNTDTETKNN